MFSGHETRLLARLKYKLKCILFIVFLKLRLMGLVSVVV
jgi:hypothetical protein